MLTMKPGLLQEQVFQSAYVTTDMDRAIALFGERYGAGDYLRTGVVNLPLVTGEVMTLDIALGWVGDVMIEIIQPIAGRIDFYCERLPDTGFAVAFHHIGLRIHSAAAWDALVAEAEAKGHDIKITLAAGPKTRVMYIDTNAELGHYLEYIYYAEPETSNLSRIPQNIPGHVTRF